MCYPLRPDSTAIHRQVATHAAKILAGTKPSDIPNRGADKIRTVANLKTAEPIGVELPTAILLRADEVIEQPIEHL